MSMTSKYRYPFSMYLRNNSRTITFDDDHDSISMKPFYIHLYIVLFALSAVVGLGGNILIIVAFLASRILRNLRNVFIINLTLADVMVTGVTMPMSIIGVTAGRQYFSENEFVCVFSAVVCAPGCIASTLSICTIAISRYFYICQYSNYLQHFTKRRIISYVTVIWILSFVAHAPNYFGWGTIRYSSYFQFCTFDSEHQLFSLYYASFFLISIIVTATFYLKMYLIIRKTCLPRQLIVRKRVRRCGNEINLTDEIRLVKASFKIFVVFLIFWAPVTVLILTPHSYKRFLPSWVYLYAALAAHSNSTMNAFIYWFDNDSFRLAMEKICKGSHSSTYSIPVISNFKKVTTSSCLMKNDQTVLNEAKLLC